jgi:hypothetical protein
MTNETQPEKERLYDLDLARVHMELEKAGIGYEKAIATSSVTSALPFLASALGYIHGGLEEATLLGILALSALPLGQLLERKANMNYLRALTLFSSMYSTSEIKERMGLANMKSESEIEKILNKGGGK